MKSIAFVVATPYQLFNICNILPDLDLSNKIVDIFITDKSILGQIEMLRKSKIFNNIFDLTYLFDINMHKKYNLKLFLVIDFFNVKYKAKSFNFGFYDELYVSYPSIKVLTITYYIRKKNKNVKICMFEDGNATYDTFGKIKNKSTALFYHLFYGWNFYSLIKEVWSYNNNIISNVSNFRIKLRTINLYKDNIYISYVRDNFYDEIVPFMDKKYIFFDQVFLSSDSEIKHNTIKLIEEISEKLGYENFILKIHPRVENMPMMNSKIQVSFTKIPFEIIFCLIPRVEDLCLISLFSSACITPKLILNKEPKVIYLSRISSLCPFNVINFIEERYKNLYSVKDKVKFPSSISELLSILGIC